MKILILRFSSIGDIVLTSPVIRCVKQQTNASVHYATKGQYATLLQDCPYIDELHLLDHNETSFIAKLKQESFDVIIDLHRNIRTKRIKLALGVSSHSFNKVNIKKWMYVNLKWDKLPDIHIVDRYFATVADLQVKNDGHGLNYWLPNEMKAVKSEKIIYAIGGQHTTKKLPEDKILELCEQINLPISIIGGPEDAEIGEIIAHKLTNVTSHCGQFSVAESAKSIAQADVVITHDTGMMHIAAAFQKNIITIWGNTTPRLGMEPYFGRQSDAKYHSAEVDLNCRPCSKIGYNACPKQHFNCMKQQDLAVISEVVKSWMN